MISFVKHLPIINSIKIDNRDVDWLFIITVTCLLSLGLVMVFSSSVATINPSLHQGANFRFFYLQLAYLSLGIVAMFIVWMIPIHFWNRYSRLLLVASIIMLTLVLVPGIGAEINGSRRWIPLGPIRIQPSELVKLLLIIYMSGYICRKGELLERFKVGILTPSIVIIIIAGLLMAEPDYGTTVVIIATMGAMLFVGGIRLSHAILILAVAVGLLLALAFTSEYRVARLMSFTNPWLDPYDKGFQLSQALIAIGRGEWFGVGLGNSVQKLSYLPHAHNDFILAVIGEELGFVGILFVISLFVIFVWRILLLAKKAEYLGFHFGSKICQGIAVLIGFQALINMGVNLGALPTKGLTLPFLSYGGSSILVSCIELGLIFAINKEVTRLQYQESTEPAASTVITGKENLGKSDE